MLNQKQGGGQKAAGLTLDLDKLNSRYSTISGDDHQLFNASPMQENSMTARAPMSTSNFKIHTLEEQLRNPGLHTSRAGNAKGLQSSKMNTTSSRLTERNGQVIQAKITGKKLTKGAHGKS